MHRLVKRFLSLTILATVLLAASGPARAQSLEQLQEDIIALDLASGQGMLHLIYVAEDRIDAGRSDLAIKALNALAHVIDKESEIDNSTADALLSSIELSIDVLIADPQEWWCDQDGDGYTVYMGVSYFAPSVYCSNDPGLGLDSDDNDPNVPGSSLQEWWADYDGDGALVYLGSSYTAPTEYAFASPVPPPCLDIDDNDPFVGCI
jgi:hypothetical protein